MSWCYRMEKSPPFPFESCHDLHLAGIYSRHIWGVLHGCWSDNGPSTHSPPSRLSYPSMSSSASEPSGRSALVSNSFPPARIPLFENLSKPPSSTLLTHLRLKPLPVSPPSDRVPCRAIPRHVSSFLCPPFTLVYQVPLRCLGLLT